MDRAASAEASLSTARFEELLEIRVTDPARIAQEAGRRRRRPLPGDSGRLLIIAADHPARGILGVGSDPRAMADRRELLGRLLGALAQPGVDGVLATPDIMEDLLLLGALDGKIAIGSMNRGGLAGSVWELDDRFTAYTAESVVAAGLDGGKMLLRLDDTDRGSLETLAACAAAVGGLGEAGRMALIEPLPVDRDEGGKLRLAADPARLARAVSVAAALGPTSAYTWLKLPVSDDMELVAGATTLPVLLLGGDPGADDEGVFESWERALLLPQVRGLVAGRTLLFPPDGDAAGAARRAAALVHGEPG